MADEQLLYDVGCNTQADIARCDVQTKDGMKMGKSLGNVLEPGPLVAAYGHDAVRFFFLKEVIFGQVSASGATHISWQTMLVVE